MKAQSQYKPIGQLRTQLTGGPPPVLHGNRPIYGKRWQYLPSVKKQMFQVQICFLGSLMWINVNPNDVK